MSLFGSLYTGVSGLSAQSQSTSMIANNIANVNTVGFKRSEAAFFSLVTSEGRSTAYSPGTVSVDRIQRVTEQGPIQQSTSTTDTSISGNGMYPVKRDGSGSSQSEYLYTRNGQFSEDSQGFLTNTAGFYLYGWPLDQNGKLPSNQGDLTSLVPLNVAFLGGLTRPTTTAEIALNLDATNGGEADHTLAGALTSAPDFSRSLTMYDSLGNAQPVTFEYVKVYGPQGTAASNINNLSATTNLVSDLGITSQSQFTIATDGGAVLRTYDVGRDASLPPASGTAGDVVVNTLGDIINDINSNVPGVSAFLGNDGELVIQRDDFTGGTAQSVDLANVGAGTALAGLGLTAGSFKSNDLASGTAVATGTVNGLTPATTMASLGVANGQTISVSQDGGPVATYTATVPGDTVNTLLTFLNGVAGLSASLDTNGHLVVQHTNATTATLTFSGTALGAVGLSTTNYVGKVPYDNGAPTDSPPYSTGDAAGDNQGRIFPAPQYLPGDVGYNSRGWWQVKVIDPNNNVLSTGLVNFTPDGTLNALPDSKGEKDIELGAIDWGNGSALQTIDVDISRHSQFSGSYTVLFADQNGAELGLRTGVDIDRDGFVIARFSNGATSKLYKIPLVTFANENGLQEVSGTAYKETEESGEENLREAGTGGAGFIEPSTLEMSNVDLADEFAKLIVSQRAYSANTKVITTVDQMTQELLSLR